jgi:hypothetical protein
MLQAGEYWVDVAAEDDGWPPRRASARLALPGYRERFGSVLEERRDGERHLVRLRGLDEYRGQFEEPGRFLLLMGEEITDREGAHINAFNLTEAIAPAGGSGPADRIRRNFEAISAARDADGRPVTAVVNHPNYLWALTAEELAGIAAVRHFELYNGHLHVNNAGEPPRAGTERMWDIMLALRHATGGAPIHGVATDDAHGYRTFSDSTARQGRAWIMVRADRLEPRLLLDAIDAGDFYASTGVTLRDVRRDGATLRIEIEPEPGATYHTRFIGTRRGEPLDSRAVRGADGDTIRTTRAYAGAIGVVLGEARGPVAEYTFRGDELYVRATVVSSAGRTDPGTGRVLGPSAAWTQPIRP